MHEEKINAVVKTLLMTREDKSKIHKLLGDQVRINLE